MKAFPIGFVTSDRHLLIVGGGAETEGRLKHALAFDWARIRILLPKPDRAIAGLASSDARVETAERAVTEDDVAWAHLVIEDSGSRAVAEQLDRWCATHRVPLNAMDKPDLCDLYYTSLLFRDPLIVSISSSGDAPALSSALRRELDGKIGPGWATAARILAEARRQLPSGQVRIDLLKKLTRDQRFLDLVALNDEAGMKYFVENELRSVRT
jgi:siroheme synthase-like protein